jgi:Ca2+-binding RTX toxin-like protein
MPSGIFHASRQSKEGLAWWALLFVTLATLCALALPDTAATGKRIVVKGAHSGSHLKLKVRGDRMIVRGLMARRGHSGCRLVRHRVKAVCSLRRVNGITVDMGPSGDMVEVLDRLPARLTIYLGGGSDKFIGNGERDTCFSQGARRNRCIGRGGNDICITGPRNSDCVGGRGNDFCKHRTGSDGCWGGPGRDVCVMGPGHDGCHGDGGRDRLYGGKASDRLYGGRGHDFCDGQGAWGKSRGCETGPRR